MPDTNEIPFAPDEWLWDRHNPGQPAQYTGVQLSKYSFPSDLPTTSVLSKRNSTPATKRRRKKRRR